MNGATTIQINGQTVGLKFAYPAIKWFTEESETNDLLFVPGETGGFTVEGFAKLIQCSYRNSCLIKEIEPSLRYEDFYNYVESNQDSEEGQKELTRITEIYAASSVMKKLVEATDKKKESL